jgi:hypothetical protein
MSIEIDSRPGVVRVPFEATYQSLGRPEKIMRRRPRHSVPMQGSSCLARPQGHEMHQS